MSPHAATLANPTQSRRRAQSDLAYADAINKEDEKRKRDLAMQAIGQRSGMSLPDQEAAARGESLGGGLLPGQTNASPRATRITSPVTAPVSIGSGSVSLNMNTPNAAAAGATAASPLPVTPAATRFTAPTPLTGPGGNATTDAAALAANLAQTQPGGLRSANGARVSPNVTPSPTAPPAQAGVGKVISSAQGVAQGLDPLTGPNGYGSGGVRYVKPGEQRQGPSQVTADGVVGAGSVAPFNHEAARTALHDSWPEVFTAGSPANLAFVKHVKDQQAAGMTPGQALQHAHENADSILAPTLAKAPAAGRSGSPGKGTDALADASLPAAQRAGAAVRNAGSKLKEIASLPDRAASAIDTGISKFATGLTGSPYEVHPAQAVLAASKNFIAPNISAIPPMIKAGADKVADLIYPQTTGLTSPTQPPTVPPTQIAPAVPPSQNPPQATTSDQDPTQKKLRKLQNPTL